MEKDLRKKFENKLKNRKTLESANFHEVFNSMSTLEVGEELKDDIWTIIKTLFGWIVKGINIGVVFIPNPQ